MHLFQLGDFVLNSGARSSWKIECDALADEDWESLALMIHDVVGPFRSVEGVPGGGLMLASFLKGKTTANAPHLIVDDVLTTGGSMELARTAFWKGIGKRDEGIIGAVVFARGPCPSWITPLFQMPEKLWVRKSALKDEEFGALEQPRR